MDFKNEISFISLIQLRPHCHLQALFWSVSFAVAVFSPFAFLNIHVYDRTAVSLTECQLSCGSAMIPPWRIFPSPHPTGDWCFQHVALYALRMLKKNQCRVHINNLFCYLILCLLIEMCCTCVFDLNRVREVCQNGFKTAVWRERSEIKRTGNIKMGI